MPYAACLPHFSGRKKKVKGFIIPPFHFLGKIGNIEVNKPVIEVAQEIQKPVPVQKETESPVQNSEPVKENTTVGETKISAFSLSGIKAKKALEANLKIQQKTSEDNYPTEPFNETDMLLQWNKFAQKLEDRGQKILHTLMLINDPKLDGTTIIHELPNESTREEFEKAKIEILGYLRGMLHNHDITIKIIVNEKPDNRKAFTPQEKYDRLKEINPNLELLRKTFDLDV